jgi:desulfoferrodoxin (superoxide reductase-like protein)
MVILLTTAVSLSAQTSDDISGAYEFEHENEFIQLIVERGKLDGYISKLGDEMSDSGTPLTYFFNKANAQGTHVIFSTKQVHGLWYSFEGDVVRGSGKVREDAGYYLLQGTMTMHHVDSAKHEMTEKRSVSFRSRRGNT